MTIFKSELQTAHFLFEAYGNSANEAKQALVLTLEMHGKQYKLPQEWWLNHYEFSLKVLQLNQGYRDGEKL